VLAPVNNSATIMKGAAERAKQTCPQLADISKRDGASRAVVLVVDDDDFVREITTDILTDQGYDVLQAADGGAALEALSNGRIIDILLADVVMNKMSGPELARQVRVLHPLMPVVFMSGYAGLADDEGDLSLFQLIKKPFRPGDLHVHIEAALVRSRGLSSG
jgi:CheY-like chemotaxis protein